MRKDTRQGDGSAVPLSLEENLYWSNGDVYEMNFLSIDWADSNIESIFIEYNRAALTIWNDSLQKELLVECVGLAGITNVCVWDDTIIMSASIHPVCNEDNDFVRNLFLAYEKDFDYGGRSLNKGLLELEIQLSNYITFSIFCQKIDVKEQGDGSVVS